MKRYGELFAQITSFDNLLCAAQKAQCCKRFRDEVLAFNYSMERHLFILQRELRDCRYSPGEFRTFLIYEPKRRFISAAPYRDRVVHHALCNIVEPLFDRSFIDSSYACRAGKGTHRGLRAFIKNARKFRHVLRADVQRFFPSIDHQILKDKYRRKIKCEQTLWLMDLILDKSNEPEPVIEHFFGDDLLAPVERRHGLPIGNLTSQLWANVYLNDIDHKMAQTFGGSRYLRYVDDIALFSDSLEELEQARQMLRSELEGIRLRLHPAKTELLETKRGANFLGFRVLNDRVRVRQENLRRGRKRLRLLCQQANRGLVTAEHVTESLRSWAAHLAHGNTWRLRQKVFGSIHVIRAGEGIDIPGAAGRQLQQQFNELSLGLSQQQQPGQREQQQRFSLAASSRMPGFVNGN